MLGPGWSIAWERGDPGAVYWHSRTGDVEASSTVQRAVPAVLERVSRAEAQRVRDLRETLRTSFAELTSTPRVRSVIEVIELRCEVPAEGDAISELRRAGMHKTHARISAAFVRAEALGQLRAGLDAERCARSLHFVISGALRMFLLDPEHIDLERDGLAAIDLALRAVARDPSLFDALG